jgi:hypothetical protein
MDYKQEESRSIKLCDIQRSADTGDSAAIKNQVASLKAEFDTTSDVPTFLARNGSPGN